MRAESDWATAGGVGCIQDKTRWTKALGEAVMVVYGDCTGEIGRSRCNNAVGHENTGPSLMQRLVATGWRNAIENRPTGGNVMKQVEPLREALAQSDTNTRSVVG